MLGNRNLTDSPFTKDQRVYFLIKLAVIVSTWVMMLVWSFGLVPEAVQRVPRLNALEFESVQAFVNWMATTGKQIYWGRAFALLPIIMNFGVFSGVMLVIAASRSIKVGHLLKVLAMFLANHVTAVIIAIFMTQTEPFKSQGIDFDPMSWPFLAVWAMGLVVGEIITHVVMRRLGYEFYSWGKDT